MLPEALSSEIYTFFWCTEGVVAVENVPMETESQLKSGRVVVSDFHRAKSTVVPGSHMHALTSRLFAVRDTLAAKG